ncbi:MAP kinase-interacting serine/threonine-protein kinase 1-like [Meleagris gallopavo]|uniref:MAP kinase-interacting serine/threonine-protein kinase 1-like n=1 Tax=Meleagris gallopavo TaxID=9103 RepID=UPI000549D088|nr:MAP kinase-interacting serine/threonine-protein kinase 1-like [Meleagris gallopavo]
MPPRCWMEAGQNTAVELSPFPCTPEEMVSSQPLAIADSGKRKKKKRTRATDHVPGKFEDLYKLTAELLGEGAYAKVQGAVSLQTGKEYAVKVSTE